MQNPTKVLVSLLSLLALVLAVNVFFVPVHWDEGWNLCCARTLVESGVYGCRYLGEITSPRMSTGWLSVLPAAAGFSVFGVGYAAGRALAAIATLLSFGMLYWLGKKLWSPRAGIFAIVLAALLAGDARWSPLTLGVQAMGEPALIFFLLLGYSAMVLALSDRRRAILFLLPAAISFSLAALSKPQAQPFVAAALLLPPVFVFVAKWRREALYFAVLAILTYGSFKLLSTPPIPYAAGTPNDGSNSFGIVGAVAWVPLLDVRLRVWKFLLLELWTIVLGVVVFLKGFTGRAPGEGSDRAVLPLVMVSLIAFTASWFFWFMFLSLDFVRYAYPFAFTGTLFAGAAADTLIGRKSANEVVRWLKGGFAGSSGKATRLAASIISLLFFASMGLKLGGIAADIRNRRDSNGDLIKMASFINSNTAAQDVIETYDSEVFHLINRPYHYPPDQWSISRIRSETGKGDEPVPYDPLAANPNYLLVGPWSEHVYKIYDRALDNPRVAPVVRFGEYSLYKVAP